MPSAIPATSEEQSMQEFNPIDGLGDVENYPNFLALIWDDVGLGKFEPKMVSEVIHARHGLSKLKKVNWAKCQKKAEPHKLITIQLPNYDGFGILTIRFNPLNETLASALENVPSIEVHSIMNTEVNIPTAYVLFAKDKNLIKPSIKTLKAISESLIDFNSGK